MASVSIVLDAHCSKTILKKIISNHSCGKSGSIISTKPINHACVKHFITSRLWD
jgi:hypothetical protein